MTFLQPLLISAAAVGAVNTAGFFITATTKTHKITDLCGTAGFLASAVAVYKYNTFLALAGPMSWRGIIAGGAVTLWSIRLGAYLVQRVLYVGEDERLRQFFPDESSDEKWFDTKKSNFPLNLAGFWSIQSLWGFAVSLPVTLAMSAALLNPPKSPALLLPSLGVYGCICTTLIATGLIIETVSDRQKWNFKTKPENKNKFCNVGLWKYSRHPNYFGDILFWCSMTALAFPVVRHDIRLLTLALLSPLLTMTLLLGVSGIPMLEKQHDSKYGSNDEYIQWKSATSILIPLPPFTVKKID